jgi:hypothetical protein
MDKKNPLFLSIKDKLNICPKAMVTGQSKVNSEKLEKNVIVNSQ